MGGLWERIYLRADAKIPRSERSAGLEFLGDIMTPAVSICSVPDLFKESPHE
jgi:hypothetical protein